MHNAVNQRTDRPTKRHTNNIRRWRFLRSKGSQGNLLLKKHEHQITSVMKETDVLIIGAGPTGLTLALELSLQNIPIRIIDSISVRSDKSRALVLHPRTLELMKRHGLVGKFQAHGIVNTAVRIFANKKFVYEVDILDIGFGDTEFPTPMMISQADIEGVMDDALAKYGVCVEMPVTAEKLAQDEDGVTAWLKDGQGNEEVLRCKYVVGCDGAHSIVRRSTGLEFKGAAYPQDFILADVHLKWAEKACLTLFMGQGFMAIFPMKDGVFRIICSRPNQVNVDTEPTIEDFEEVFRTLAPGKAELLDPVWIARFRLHHRNVEKYRVGRMFLAGDAAHIHSPAGGQGMNTGIHDAINLGWKLASVIRGEGNNELLDSYTIERHRVGENLLKGTDRLFEMMATTHPIYLYLRNTFVPWILPWVMGSRGLRANRFRFISQLGIRYRHSPVVGQASTYKGPLRGGDRTPDGALMGAEVETSVIGLLMGPTYHLLLFSGTGSEALNGEGLHKIATDFLNENKGVKVHEICAGASPSTASVVDKDGDVHKLYSFQEPSYVLVRPDGYIAFIGQITAMGELKTWLKG
jgi:2-polyprenyl-6-methoxyphenol hydroxylase-like FAD-dependent oxidoreductase